MERSSDSQNYKKKKKSSIRFLATSVYILEYVHI